MLSNAVLDPPKPRRPWLTMWYRPRQTVREIIAYNPNYGVAGLSVLIGIGRALERASARSAGDTLSPNTVLALVIVGGAISGPVVVHIFGFLYHRIGARLGGRGSSAALRAAIAWSAVPSVWALVLWAPQALLLGPELFTSATPVLDSSPARLWIALGLSLLSVAASLWSVGLLVAALAEAHQFSLGRALLTLLLGVVVVVLLALGLGICVLAFNASL